MPRPQLAEPFAVATHRVGGHHHVVCPSGELDVATAPALERNLSHVEQGDAKHITLDLRRLTFIDSAGLHLLERAHQRSLRNGIRLEVIAGPPAVQRTLRLAAIGQRLAFVAAGPAGNCGLTMRRSTAGRASRRSVKR